jgi:rod shape-determining protein MreD
MARMRELPYIVLLIVCLVIQVAVLNGLGVMGAAPNLLFIVALYAALFAPKNHAVLAAVMAGLACDIFASGRFGVHALLFGALAAVLVHVREKVFKEHPIIQAVIAFAALGAIEAAGAFAAKLQYGDASFGALIASGVLGALWTAALVPFALALLVKFNRKMGFIQKRSFADA